jgi:hypothetical protein
VADSGQAAANAVVNCFVDSWNRADGVAYAENYQLSFYRNRPDKRVDGSEDVANYRAIRGTKHVLCDECGGTIGYWGIRSK